MKVFVLNIKEKLKESREDIGKIFRTIGYQEEDTMKSYLYSIIKYEEKTSQLLTGFIISFEGTMRREKIQDELMKNFIINETGVDLERLIKLYQPVKDSYYDVFGKDERFLGKPQEFQNLHCHVATKEGKYLGHVYSWTSYKPNIGWPETSKNTLLVQGIRSSLLNFLLKSTERDVKQISYVLIDSTIAFAKFSRKETVSVVMPLSVMMQILEKYGFKSGRYYIFNVDHEPLIVIPDYRLFTFDDFIEILLNT